MVFNPEDDVRIRSSSGEEYSTHPNTGYKDSQMVDLGQMFFIGYCVQGDNPDGFLLEILKHQRKYFSKVWIVSDTYRHPS